MRPIQGVPLAVAAAGAPGLHPVARGPTAGEWRGAVFGHTLLLAETFVDIARFRGTCYRASNWLYVGDTRGFARRGTSYQRHGRPKAVFVYPLRRRAHERLRALDSPLESRTLTTGLTIP